MVSQERDRYLLVYDIVLKLDSTWGDGETHFPEPSI